jgi:hypothetical protein
LAQKRVGEDGLQGIVVSHCYGAFVYFSFNLPLVSFSFEQIDYRGTTNQFWKSIGQAIQPGIGGARVASDRNPIPPIISQQTFLGAFLAENWALKVVILIDELSELHSASEEVRDDFLRALRVTRNNPEPYAIESVIAAGTFSILLLNPSQSSISPFNISDRIDNPYFTVEETRTLFDEYAQDQGIMIDGAVVEDIWVRSNGCFSIARIKVIIAHIHLVIREWSVFVDARSTASYSYC